MNPPLRLLAGTSGYSYKEWLGHFYPEKLPANEFLRYYAERFTTVEINNTFYRMPAESMLEQWTQQVPEHFTFTLKAPKRITHDRRLRDDDGYVGEFLKRAHTLGAKLGVVLFQLPPYLKKDPPRLNDFLATLPAELRVAFEFRNDTWQDGEIYDALAKRNAILCVTDTDEGDTPFVATTSRGYLRLRRTFYSSDELLAWAKKIAAKELPETYVYFMHEDEALGTGFATQLNAHWTALGGQT